MVHVVKGRQHGAYTVAPQSQRWSLRPTLDLDSDKFRCYPLRVACQDPLRDSDL